ncbi:MAG: MATE family efflux transporter [Salinarimonas sp.]
MSQLDGRSTPAALAATLRLAVPLMIAQVATVALALIDTITFGYLGTQALAGGGLGASIFSLVNITCVGVLMATGNIVAFAHGAGRPDEVRAAVAGGAVVALGLGLATMLVALRAGEAALRATGQAPAVAATAAIYLSWASLGLVPSLLLTVLRGLTVGLGRPGPITAITIAAVATKSLLNMPLIWLTVGMDDAQRAGFGAAWTGAATAATYLVMAGAAWVWCRKRLPEMLPRRSARPWRVPRTSETLRLGLPIGLTYGVEAGLFTMVALIVGRSGEIALAAHTIGNQLVYVAFMVIVGLSHAASVRVGQAAGAGNLAEARRRGREALLLTITVTSVTAAVFAGFGEPLAAMFVGRADDASQDVVALAGTLLLIAAAFQWADGAQNVAMGALRGLKDSRATAIVAIVAYWGVGIPAAWWLAADHGAVGAWWGLCIGLYTAAALMLLRFERVTGITETAAEPAAGA